MLPKEEQDYLNKLCKEFDIQRPNAHTKKLENNTTYKELYREFVSNRKIVQKLQEVMVDKSGKDIFEAECFKRPYNRQLAGCFVNSIFAIDIDRPIHKGLALKSKRVLEFLGVKYE